MHKLNYWLIALLAVAGLAIGMISLYMASLSGIMGKMGLLGGDFSNSVKTNSLARLILAQKGTTSCDIWSVSRSVPNYMKSEGGERVELAYELGGQRVVCGIKLVQRGNVERGVYTLIKGLQYLREHNVGLRTLVEQDLGNCKMIKQNDYSEWIQGYLLSTEGRVNVLVADVYREVERERDRVGELCTTMQ